MGWAATEDEEEEAEMGLMGFGRGVKNEGLVEVGVRKRRRGVVADDGGGGDRRMGEGLERKRDRRWRDGGCKDVEKRAEASIDVV